MARATTPLPDITHKQYDDSFYIIEYLGHPLSTIPNRLREVSLQNGVSTIAPGEAAPGVTQKMSGGYKVLPMNTTIRSKPGYTVQVSSKLIKLIKVKKLAAKANTHMSAGVFDRLGVPSLLPGDTGNKVQELTVEISATPNVPEAYISFSNVTQDELFAGVDAGFTWHNRGAGYRIWIGSRSATDHLATTIDETNLTAVFEGFVNAVDYEYGSSGIGVSLRLNNHKSVFLKRPLSKKLWEEDNVNSAYELIKAIGVYLGIEANNVQVEFNYSDENKAIGDKLKASFGLQPSNLTAFTDEEIVSINSFYQEFIKGPLERQYADKTVALPTPADLLNMLSNAIGLRFRWHLTPDGILFFGLPPNPNKQKITDPTAFAKKFYYREAPVTPFKAMDVFYSDYFSSVKVYELEKAAAPEMGNGTLNVASGVTQEEDTGTTPAQDTVKGNAPLTEAYLEFYFKGNVTGEAPKEKNIFLSTKSLPLGPQEYQKLASESLAYGNLSLEISGCMVDPKVRPMMYFYFSGFHNHTGSYIVTSVKYSFSSGSKPDMTLTGLRPVSVEEAKAQLGLVLLNKSENSNQATPGEENNAGGEVVGNAPVSTGAISLKSGGEEESAKE